MGTQRREKEDKWEKARKKERPCREIEMGGVLGLTVANQCSQNDSPQIPVGETLSEKIR